MIARRKPLLILFCLSTLTILLISIFLGNEAISTDQLLRALGQKTDALSRQILISIRIPHALTVFVTGGLLALAGALMQVLVRNPLADPYVLGTSGGAACATLLLMLMGFSGFILTLGATFGSLTAILFVFMLCRQSLAEGTQTLLLTGIALACGFSALVSLILFASPDPGLRPMLFWLVGDFSFAHVPWLEGSILLVGLLLCLCSARELNLLARGAKEAAALGVNIQRLHWQCYLLSALFTATAVTLAGCVGFVGLVVPHLFRLSFGSDHRLLLPGCVLLGGGLLCLADLIARHVFFPSQLPVGIIMTLIGVPLFIVLLQKKSP